MAERTHIPGSPACGEWETLLTDALDGLLKPEDEAKFASHMAACPACARLYDEARKGREWLEFLSPEPEVPAGLLEKILAKTGPGQPAEAGWSGNPIPVAAGAGTVPVFMPPVWQQPGFIARMRAAMRPQMLMTAAMAFFSIALTLNMTGVRLSNVHVTALQWSDLRPRAMRAYFERQLTMASVPLVRYYDHLRFVYEVESRVRELRGQVGDEGNGEQRRDEQQPTRPGETRRNPDGKDGGMRVDPQQEQENPAMEPAIGTGSDLLESSLELNEGDFARNNAALRASGRSTVWIA